MLPYEIIPEPVHEEPRQFRVGDKVVYEYENGDLEYTIIQAIIRRGDIVVYATMGDCPKIGKPERYRLANPEEIAIYFAPNA
jgi:hypothetical protein